MKSNLTTLISSVIALCGIVIGPTYAGEITQTALMPLPSVPQLDSRKVSLGKALFSDKRFSADDSISCVSCHSFKEGGSNRKQFATGIHGALGEVKTPTVFNASLNFKQFWDGRANGLDDQIDGPVSNPKEMGSNWPAILTKLRADPSLERSFLDIYKAEPDRVNVIDALVNFEESLLTENSPFDLYLKGDAFALNPKQVRGYRKFQDYGCVACHQGANIGGNMYQSLGIMGDYFKDRGGKFKSDLGRYNITGQEQDKHVFKVPSLRNVALSAPYFHDGTVPNLETAIRLMAKYQLGRNLSTNDIDELKSFLESLTGEPPASLQKDESSP